MDRRIFILGFTTLVLVAGLIARPALAGERKIEGTVTVTKEGDDVKSIELAEGEKKYKVKLDENGKKVADYDGKTVVVNGDVNDDGEVTVKSVEEKKKE